MQTELTIPNFHEQLHLSDINGTPLFLQLDAKGLPSILSMIQALVDNKDVSKTELVDLVFEEFWDIPKEFLQHLVNILIGDDEKYFLIREDRFGNLTSYG